MSPGAGGGGGVLSGGRNSSVSLTNEDVACYNVIKLSWKGRYARIFSVGTRAITTYNVGDSMVETNKFEYQDFVGIEPVSGKGSDTEFVIKYRKSREGKKIADMKFASEYRADILTEALKFKHLFCEPRKNAVWFNATKKDFADLRVPVILEVGEVAITQQDPTSRECFGRYYYKDIGNLAKLMDGPPGGISISVESYKRLHLFVVEKRDVFLQTVAEYAMRHVGVLISYKEEMSEETAQLKRFGRYSVDEAVTSLCDFMVHKISVKHRDPVKRILGISESCLVERDCNTYNVTSLRPLSDVAALVRDREEPRKFSIEFVSGGNVQKSYFSSNRDALLASLLDGVRASGNRDVHVRMSHMPRGKRCGPLSVPVCEDVEIAHLKFLHTHPSSWSFSEAVERFNANVPYSGLLHTAKNKDALFENKDKMFQAALTAVLAKEGEQDRIPFDLLEQQFHALRRLVACKAGFAAFTQVPQVRERIGKKVITALSRGDPAVSHAAVDMLCALIQPMHDDCDLFQEQQNKLSVLSSKNFLEQLLNMFTQHVQHGTGCLVVSAMLDFLTFSLCAPYSETTDGAQFDALLELVAQHAGRMLFKLFQHSSIAIVRGAGLVMKAIIEEGESELAAKMQDLALAEAALPRHLLDALYASGSESRLFALRELSRQLVGLWLTGHPPTMNALKRIMPAGLLAYMDSKEMPPKEAIETLRTRDNLRMATEHSNNMNHRASSRQWRVVERHVEQFLMHWKSRVPQDLKGRIGLGGSDDRPTTRQQPVVLRRRRQRVKSTANWTMFYYQFHQDHAKPHLIWNYKTREELKDALENELRSLTQDRELCHDVTVSWNHHEFEVIYPSLSEELQVGDFFLRLLLEEDDRTIKTNANSFNSSTQPSGFIMQSSDFFNDLYHRFLLSNETDMKCLCLRAMAIVYGRHHFEIGAFNDTKYIIDMLQKTSNRLERDRLIMFIDKLVNNKKNIKYLLDSNGIKVLVEFLCLAHLHTSRAVIPAQTNVIEASTEIMMDQEKEWFYNNNENGPHSINEMKKLYKEGTVNTDTKVWAQGMDGWHKLSEVGQLKWTLMAHGTALRNETDLAALILDILIKVCEVYPTKEPDGSIVRPLPRAKRRLCDPSIMPHVVQLLLTFDPILVEKVAVLLTHVMQHNPAIQRLYQSGFFFFILMYTGSNVLPIGNLLHLTHTCQAFRTEESSSLKQRSILGNILPEAMICYLENHGAAKFAEIFLGEFDTPEAIWNSEMRRFMIEKIATHIADFTPRLKSNTRAPYQYCPLPQIQYPQLQNELFCSIYYLRHLCDTVRYPDWPILEPVQLLKDVLDTWKTELNRKPPEINEIDACEILGLKQESKINDCAIRKAYFGLAAKYHPDKNPEGREMFEKVNKAYEFLSDASTRKTNGPDPVNLSLILKAQAILFCRCREALHPYKYAGYPMLIKMIETETQDDQLLSKQTPLLGLAIETMYHTLNCSELNVQELRREDGLAVLGKAFVRCVEQLSHSSTPEDLVVSVCRHSVACFAVAAKFESCRTVLIKDLPNFVNDLCRILYFKHLTELCAAAVECIASLSVCEQLQNSMLKCGVLFHLLLFFFKYDYTLGEGGVEVSKESNQQAVTNHLAELSVRACARLAGLESSDSTPSNQRIRQCLVALLTPYVVRKLGNSEPSSILKVLNSNTENPYLIWDNSTRAELTEYLEQQQKSKIRSGECDEDYGASFLYSLFDKELVVGDIFVRIYIEQPTFPLEDARQFTKELLSFIGSQAQFIYSAKNSNLVVTKDAESDRIRNAELAMEALHHVILNNPSVETLCIGHFKLLFLLLNTNYTRLRVLAVGVIQAVTGNKNCVQDIASVHVLVFLLLVLKSFQSNHQHQQVVLDTLLPLMSSTQLVKEALSKGALLYLLDVYCNASDPKVRERTAELVAKMSGDKLSGPKLLRMLARFMPAVFLDAMKESPQDSVTLFEGNQENPELIWNDESRERLCLTVRQMCQELFERQTENPTELWNPSPDFSLCAEAAEDELVIGGVYVRLFVQSPGWSLRRPKEFLGECLDRACQLMARQDSDEAMLDTVTTAIVGLLANQGQLRDAIPVMGHIPRLVAALGSPAPQAKHAVRLLHELAQSQQCVEQLCESGDCMAGLRSAINNCPETLDLVAKALNQMFQKDASRLVQQALSVKLVSLLLELLERSVTNATSKAHIVQALKAMLADPIYGDDVNELLTASKTWADFKDQRHDLFTRETTIAGYLPSTTNIAGYLTTGTIGPNFARQPPPVDQ
ncbi:dnaJ homolog subfamily C member 13-like [Varroa jacobsoni]|nr:dnaJ homolog subfamily C member 13-like isoform X2 [Varroa destructor]XP_022662014.1 dnaJ homolog subfamily C member 13-like isoform X2 [Varroa destructor]XP_022662015.1 dnaJ homolog subfamily C member 13-like isoform X2 [Varroa destructor]XP_022689935.1 dnaJ homolog subfamily C member 13-like [Varroa jacobsoni]XP_022689936.1 dnaJ homolog subfamily C member 13-like [Varroa jacobsoni]XP_022689937.1 dnaJ homolog subfamily C member 13-like [Varroa jacobsoni]